MASNVEEEDDDALVGIQAGAQRECVVRMEIVHLCVLKGKNLGQYEWFIFPHWQAIVENPYNSMSR